jgi:superfamily II DNA or RNA helicase
MNKTPTTSGNTYLGQKGYTILKKDLSEEMQKKIIDDLTIKPFVMGSPMTVIKTFPVYRESANKFYLPYYYGITTFGKPTEYKISEGLDIDLVFHGDLRDYQKPVIHKFLEHCKNNYIGSGLLELYCAWGKTSGSLYTICALKKKTLVIVHKSFLMNQWIERIQQFIPNARIGKIQGAIIDIVDKDIVLCMMQSLVLKEYPQNLFDDFGYTIIDEVHHISSETFSNALFKVVTKYMLGLSATMDRKDGTTHVFKSFLGEVVHKTVKKNEHEVEVRAIEYRVNDPDFNETVLDFRGKVQFSSMISKLCEYNRRTEFIIQTLIDFIRVDTIDDETYFNHKKEMDNNIPTCEICLKNDHYLVKNTCCNSVKYCYPCMSQLVSQSKQNLSREIKRAKCPHCKKVLAFEQHYIENPHIKPLEERHTIIMSHNLNVIDYIYKKMICKNIASVGLYVGGMKESELKKSETKQVILATISLASEGLDIPTLNAEFLITPKTDIVQIVGRILRAKHLTGHPIIYDFIDSHDIFKRQWKKRKTYYKQQNFKIIGINSDNYHRNFDKWENVYEPNNKKTNKKDSDSEDEKKDKYLSGKCLLKII